MVSEAFNLPEQKIFTLARKLEVRLTDGTLYIPFGNITHLQADGCYTHVHCHNGQRHFTCERLGWINSRLPHELFFRCHHSFVVNLTKVTMLMRTDGLKARLVTNEHVAVSRRRWKAFAVAMVHVT